MAREYAEVFQGMGMAADLNMHEPHKGEANPHCHMMLTMRPFEPDGSFILHKSRRVYDLDKNGERIPLKNGDFKSHNARALI